MCSAAWKQELLFDHENTNTVIKYCTVLPCTHLCTRRVVEICINFPLPWMDSGNAFLVLSERVKFISRSSLKSITVRQEASAGGQPCQTLMYETRDVPPLCMMLLSLWMYSSHTHPSPPSAFKSVSSSKSKYQNVTLWLCFLKGVDNCQKRKRLPATIFLREEETHYVPWSSRGGHQTPSENLSGADRGGTVSQGAFYWLPSCYLNPKLLGQNKTRVVMCTV